MKILILTGKFGTGHLSASCSLQQQLSEQFPDSLVEITDFSDYALPDLSAFLYRSFRLLVTRAGALFNLYYRAASHGHTDARPPFTPLLLDRLTALLCEKRPDAVIATHPLCAQLVSALKEKTGLDLPLITCITDVSSHPEWINSHTDCYLVPTSEIRAALVKSGVAPETVCVTGIPVRREFRQLHSGRYPGCAGQQTTRHSDDSASLTPTHSGSDATGTLMQSDDSASLTPTHSGSDGSGVLMQSDNAAPFTPMQSDSDDTLRVQQPDHVKQLLIMGGGLGLLPENPGFYESLDRIPGVHTTVVTGHNRRLYQKLAGRFSHIEVLGYTDRIWEYMARADLIVTKPGGITLFETIFSGVPVCTFKPTLQQERGNARWLTSRGIGWEAGSGDCAWEIRLLLNDTQLLAQAKARMAHIREQFEDERLHTVFTALSQIKSGIADDRQALTLSDAGCLSPAAAGKGAAA